MTIKRLGKIGAVVLLAPVLFVWEIIVWCCQQIVAADKALDQPLEMFTDWSER